METRLNKNVDTVDGQHAAGINRTLARLDLDNNFGSNSITADTYYGDGSNLTGITSSVSQLYQSTVLYPEYNDCVFIDGLGQNNLNIDLEQTSFSHQNYKIYGTPGTSGLQNGLLYIRQYIPDGFNGWSDSAIIINFLTKLGNPLNNYIKLSIGKFGALSYVYSSFNLLSIVPNTWDVITISKSLLMTGATPVDYFAAGDTLECKLELYCDSSNYIKLGQIKFNYEV